MLTPPVPRANEAVEDRQNASWILGGVRGASGISMESQPDTGPSFRPRDAGFLSWSIPPAVLPSSKSSRTASTEVHQASDNRQSRTERFGEPAIPPTFFLHCAQGEFSFSSEFSGGSSSLPASTSLDCPVHPKCLSPSSSCWLSRSGSSASLSNTGAFTTVRITLFFFLPVPHPWLSIP